jgi:hypothetical protein
MNIEGIEVNLACDTVEVSRSGYYSWLERPESERAMENAMLVERIKAFLIQSSDMVCSHVVFYGFHTTLFD